MNLPQNIAIKLFYKSSIETFIDIIKSKSIGDIIIHGSYRTCNIGDLSIGLTIKKEIEKRFEYNKCELNGVLFYKQNFFNFLFYS